MVVLVLVLCIFNYISTIIYNIYIQCRGLRWGEVWWGWWGRCGREGGMVRVRNGERSGEEYVMSYHNNFLLRVRPELVNLSCA